MADKQSIRGAVYVEFLIVIIPLLILMFSLVQMSFFLSAGILTHLAANKAARSAMVILSDEHPKATYAERPNHVGNDASGIDAYRDVPDESRYQTIRLAARIPLIPVSPTLRSATSESIEGAAHNMGGLELVAELADVGWTSHYVGLGFVNDKDEYVSTIMPGDKVRVRVVFLYPCFIPIGRLFACHTWNRLPEEDMDLIKLYGKETLSLFFRLAGWRYVTLRAEAPIPRWDR